MESRFNNIHNPWYNHGVYRPSRSFFIRNFLSFAFRFSNRAIDESKLVLGFQRGPNHLFPHIIIFSVKFYCSYDSPRRVRGMEEVGWMSGHVEVMIGLRGMWLWYHEINKTEIWKKYFTAIHPCQGRDYGLSTPSMCTRLSCNQTRTPSKLT